MALVDLNAFLTFPNCALLNVGDSSYETLDAAGERMANCLQAFKAGSIRNVYIRTTTVTTGKNLKASLQSINSAGDPSGTILGTTNSGYTTITVVDANDNVWLGPFQLGEDVAVAKGDTFAIVIEWANNADFGNVRLANSISTWAVQYCQYFTSDVAATQTSGTLTVGNTYRIYSYLGDDDFTNVGAGSNGTGVIFIATGTTPTKWTNSSQLRKWFPPGSRNTGLLSIALEFSDGTYMLGNTSGAYGISASISTSTNPDEIGNYVQFPVSFRATGIWVAGDFDYDAVFSLQASDGTILANCTLDADKRTYTNFGLHFLMFDADPAATYTIEKATNYRVVCTPSTTSAGVIRFIDVPEADAMGQLDFGSNCVWTQRTDAGAWSQTTTRRASIGLIADQLDDGSGGGGGIWMPRPRQIGV